MARFGKYDSRFEAHLHGNCKGGPKQCYYCKIKRPDLGLFNKLRYHGESVDYIEPATSHKYEVDFDFKVGNKKYLVEAKGRFKTTAEANKYLWIREHLVRGTELIFYFDSASTAMPNAKRRKDGTKYNHGEWAEKNGFEYYDHKSYKILEAKFK